MLFLAFIPAAALIHVIPILASRTAKHRSRSACDKCILTMFAQSQRIFLIRQQQIKHRPHNGQQGIEIPYHSRSVEQLNVIGRRNSVKYSYTLSVNILLAV